MSAAAWPALPRPGELVRLPLLAPPLLLEALDYRGEARYVAFRWSGGSGGDVLYSDGTTTAAGWWPAWLLLVREHPLGRVIFDRYELGHHDDPGQLATHWLLADRW